MQANHNSSNQDRPNWAAFFKLLAKGRMRRLGLAPMPPELKDKKDGKPLQTNRQPYMSVIFKFYMYI